MRRPAAALATALLAAVAVAHALRLVLGVEIVAGGTRVPLWVSVFGCLVPGAIAVLLWRESRGAGEG